MDVNVRGTELPTVVTPIKNAGPIQTEAAPKVETANKSIEAQQPVAKEKEGQLQLSKEDAKNITEEMNKFFQMINADLQFALHDKTKTLMVQVVDAKENKVLKEFPSHELLDTIARIRDYVGVLLDKKA